MRPRYSAPTSAGYTLICVGRGRQFNLYVRAEDEELWAWAEAQAKSRRMPVSQFVLMLIERARGNTKDD